MATFLFTCLYNENTYDLDIVHLVEMKAKDASEIGRDSSAVSATNRRAKKLLPSTVQCMPKQNCIETLILTD